LAPTKGRVANSCRQWGCRRGTPIALMKCVCLCGDEVLLTAWVMTATTMSQMCSTAAICFTGVRHQALTASYWYDRSDEIKCRLRQEHTVANQREPIRPWPFIQSDSLAINFEFDIRPREVRHCAKTVHFRHKVTIGR